MLIDGTDFWTQLASALVAGLILTFAQPFWLRSPKVGDPYRRRPEAGGNHATVSDSTVHGDLRIKQIDNTHHTTIVNNIHGSPGGRSSDGQEPWGEVALTAVAGVAAALLFLLVQPLLAAASIGAAGALAVMTAVAARRASALKVWTGRSAALCISVVIAIGTTLFTWRQISTLERGGLSLEGIRGSIPPMTGEQSADGILGTIAFVLKNALPVLFSSDNMAVPFVVFLMMGAAASVALIVFVWEDLLGWHAFLRFNRGTQKNSRIVARAKTFSEGRVAGPIFGALLLATISLVCTSGLLFDIVSNGGLIVS